MANNILSQITLSFSVCANSILVSQHYLPLSYVQLLEEHLLCYDNNFYKFIVLRGQFKWL